MKYHLFILGLSLFLMACNTNARKKGDTEKPNIIYILADDLGYGDLGCYNTESKIPTPNIDQLASQGMKFMDAHSSSAVCTPTRYGVLMGRYSWRSKLKKGVLNGYGAELLEEERNTVADLMKRNGYTTGCVGKWHLGLKWGVIDKVAAPLKGLNYDKQQIDFEKPISGGPNDHGFDYSYIIPASLDMEPYCYLENQQFTELPMDSTEGNSLNSGFKGPFWRPGKMSPSFKFDQVLPTFIDKAITFIEDQSKSESPFFLYVPLPAPHTPWLPTEEYKDKSNAGMYGDFTYMVDSQVGRILKTVKEQGIEDNTLVIFTSDNGPFWKPEDTEEYNHKAAGDLRGMKADIWEGGHRVPFIVKWPGKIRNNSSSNQLLSLTDLFATCAAVVGDTVQTDEGEDSFNFLPVFLEASDDPVRTSLINHSADGMFAIRTKEWKLIEGRGSGGFTQPKRIEPGTGEPKGQLYNLQEDLSEQNNLYEQHPDVVRMLSERLNEIRDQGNSR